MTTPQKPTDKPSDTTNNKVHAIMPCPPYRRGTGTKTQNAFFVFKEGGIGDYICHMACMRWIASTQPHIHGTIVAPEYMHEIFRSMMQPFINWRVVGNEAAKIHFKKGTDPVYPHTGRMQPNATGMHMVDLGFAVYANVNPAPQGFSYYPQINFQRFRKPKFLRSIGPYAVMTPGATTENRQLLPETFNEIKNHIIKMGITPVFLGKKELEDRNIQFHKEYDYEGGVDLRDITSLMEAAYIMSKAKFTIGLDNGLLHLAACTPCPVIFGYNVASPEHRRPKRANPKHRLYEVYPDPKVLTCTFCQSNMNFLAHDFIKCVYKDNLCLKVLGEGKGHAWKQAMDQCLKDELPEQMDLPLKG